MNDSGSVKLIELLQHEIPLLEQAAKRFAKTYSKVLALNLSSLSEDNLDTCEALVSRFARLSDFLVKKVFRLISEIELVEPESVIDVLNFAEKKALISDSYSYRDIRAMRNKIVHEYEEAEYIAIIKEVLAKAPELISACDRTIEFASKYSLK